MPELLRDMAGVRTYSAVILGNACWRRDVPALFSAMSMNRPPAIGRGRFFANNLTVFWQSGISSIPCWSGRIFFPALKAGARPAIAASLSNQTKPVMFRPFR